MRLAVLASLFTVLMLAPLVSPRADVDETAVLPRDTLELVVVEAEGCIYCGLFRRDVFPSYQASEQAKDLPIRFVDINDIGADRLDFKSDVEVVPTFVILKAHHEVARISGYVGPEDFLHSISYLLASAP